MNIIPVGAGATDGDVLVCGSAGGGVATAESVVAGWSPESAKVGSANITKINAQPETIASFPKPLRRPRNIGDFAIMYSLLNLSIRNSPIYALQQKAAPCIHFWRVCSGRLLYSLPQPEEYITAAIKMDRDILWRL